VRRTSGHGVIASGDKLSHVASIFAAQVPVDAKLQATTKLMVDAMLTRDLIIDIAMDLKKIAETQDRARAAALERRAESEQRIQPPRRRKVRANKRRQHEGRKP
jgi:hypothetical protein